MTDDAMFAAWFGLHNRQDGGYVTVCKKKSPDLLILRLGVIMSRFTRIPRNADVFGFAVPVKAGTRSSQQDSRLGGDGELVRVPLKL